MKTHEKTNNMKSTSDNTSEVPFTPPINPMDYLQPMEPRQDAPSEPPPINTKEDEILRNRIWSEWHGGDC